MKKMMLILMLTIGSMSFSNEKESSVKISNIFDDFKNEQTQKQKSSNDQLDSKNSIKISSIFGTQKKIWDKKNDD